MTEFLQNEQGHMEQYKLLVEEKLNWGNSADWRHHDFETLSRKIFEETGVLLSSTTLKRIWGKLKYDSIPNSNTLNALASFIGYENWLEFRTTIASAHAGSQAENGLDDFHLQNGHEPTKSVVGKKKRFFNWAAFALLVVTVLIFALGFILNKNKKELLPTKLSNVTFTSTPVAEGIPNTVVFKYDVSQLHTNEVAIQQSWDRRLRFNVDANRNEATMTYYYPGYFRAKLLVDGQVVKEHDLYLKTDGWLATLNWRPQPRYFLKEELKKEGSLGVNDVTITEVQTNDDAPSVVGFHYVDNFGELISDNFTLETSFKNTYFKGNGVCQLTRIVILCSEGAMIIPFSIPGCVGDLRLVINDVVQDGKKHDLSAFGCDFSQWQKLKFEVRDREVFISLNGELVHQLSYLENAGKVAGIRFLFAGNGEVDDVRLLGAEGELVFEEMFDEIRD